MMRSMISNRISRLRSFEMSDDSSSAICVSREGSCRMFSPSAAAARAESRDDQAVDVVGVAADAVAAAEVLGETAVHAHTAHLAANHPGLALAADAQPGEQMLAANGGGRLHVLRAPASADIQRALQEDPFVASEDRRPVAPYPLSVVADGAKPPLVDLRPVLVKDAGVGAGRRRDADCAGCS